MLSGINIFNNVQLDKNFNKNNNINFGMKLKKIPFDTVSFTADSEKDLEIKKLEQNLILSDENPGINYDECKKCISKYLKKGNYTLPCMQTPDSIAISLINYLKRMYSTLTIPQIQNDISKFFIVLLTSWKDHDALTGPYETRVKSYLEAFKGGFSGIYSDDKK